MDMLVRNIVEAYVSKLSRDNLICCCFEILQHPWHNNDNEEEKDVLRIGLLEKVLQQACNERRCTEVEAILAWHLAATTLFAYISRTHRQAIAHWTCRLAHVFAKSLNVLLCDVAFVERVASYWHYQCCQRGASIERLDVISTIMLTPLELSVGHNGSCYYVGFFDATKLHKSVYNALRISSSDCPALQSLLARFFPQWLLKEQQRRGATHPLFKYNKSNMEFANIVHVALLTDVPARMLWRSAFYRPNFLRMFLHASLKHCSLEARDGHVHNNNRLKTHARDTYVLLVHLCTFLRDSSHNIDDAMRRVLPTLVREVDIAASNTLQPALEKLLKDARHTHPRADHIIAAAAAISTSRRNILSSSSSSSRVIELPVS